MGSQSAPPGQTHSVLRSASDEDLRSAAVFPASRAGRRFSRCAGTCVPTSTETLIERGSVIRCDRQGVYRENGSGCRASPGGRPGAPLPGVRGALHQADRGSSWSLAGHDQGVFLRPDRRGGAVAQGPLCRCLLWLRRLHPAAHRKRVRYCTACHLGRGPGRPRRWPQRPLPDRYRRRPRQVGLSASVLGMTINYQQRLRRSPIGSRVSRSHLRRSSIACCATCG